MAEPHDYETVLHSSLIQTILSVPEFVITTSPDQPLSRVADYTAGGEFMFGMSPRPEEPILNWDL